MSPVTPWEEVQLAARAGVDASSLPSNRALPNDVTAESLHRGWTVQQPYTHITCPVPLACVLCAEELDTRDWIKHDCAVVRMLGDRWTPVTQQR